MNDNTLTPIINGCVIVCSTRSGSTLLEDTVFYRLRELDLNPLRLREFLNHHTSLDCNFTSWSLDTLAFSQTPKLNADIWNSLLIDSVTAGKLGKNGDVPVMRLALHTFDTIGVTTQQSIIRLLQEPTMLRILLMRRSVKDQISSVMLSDMTKIYNIKQDDAAAYDSYTDIISQIKQNPQPVDQTILDAFIRSVLRSYQYLSLGPLLFDHVIWYEDLINGQLLIPKLSLGTEDTQRIMSYRKATRKLNGQTAETFLSCLVEEDRPKVQKLLTEAEYQCKLYSRGYEPSSIT